MPEHAFTGLIAYIPLGLLILALLIGFGLLSFPQPAVAAERLERQVEVDGEQRTFTVYLPENVTSGRNWRVMIVFHPFMGTGEFMEEVAQFQSTPGGENFIIVYPDGFRRTWNAGGCCGAAERRDIDDIAFFEAILKDVGTLASIRPKVYLTGFSNGALLVYQLMCMVPDQIAAAAPFASYLPPDRFADCDFGIIPLLHIHGAEDPVAPVDGGMTNVFGLLPPARQTVEMVARRNGCDMDSPEELAFPDLGTTCLHYAGACRGAEVNLCIIPDLGHVWPGMEGRGGRFGPDRPDVRGSEAIIRFFLRH